MSTLLKQKPEQATGAAFCINGRLMNIDIYANSHILTKLWTKIAKAQATEALSVLDETPVSIPSRADILNVLTTGTSADKEWKNEQFFPRTHLRYRTQVGKTSTRHHFSTLDAGKQNTCVHHSVLVG